MTDYIQIFLLLYWSLIGLFIGSFLGVVIDRLPLGKSIIKGRSHCDSCQRKLRWFELLPVLSFVIQGGKCRRCRTKLSWRYPGYELITGLTFGVLAYHLGFSLPVLIVASVVASVLIAIFFIDLDHMIIPDILLWIAGISSFGLLFLAKPLENWLSLILNHVFAAGLAFAVFYGLWALTRKKGMGFGDVLLVIIIGLITGFPRIILSLYLAFLTGAFFALILLLRRKKGLKSAVPFGPFILLGLVFSLFLDVQQLLKFIL